MNVPILKHWHGQEIDLPHAFSMTVMLFLS